MKKSSVANSIIQYRWQPRNSKMAQIALNLKKEKQQQQTKQNRNDATRNGNKVRLLTENMFI